MKFVHMIRLFLGLCLFAVLFTACEKDSTVETPKDTIPVEDVQAVAAMSSDFGWDLFHEESRGVADKNVLISPLSVQTALTMAVNGAAGKSLTEMLEALGCANCDLGDLNEQTSKLRELMEEQSGHPTLTSANGYFSDPTRIDLLDAFVETLTKSYDAGFVEYDFDDPATVGKINDWVKTHTNGKIEEIIDGIGGLDLAFLINALHFKADWATAFDPDLTFDWTFNTADGREVMVPFVSADRNFSTANNFDFRMVDMPFRDSTYSLSLVQPIGPVASEPEWTTELSAAELKEMWGNLEYGRAIVNFPKLDLEYDAGLIPSLKNLGIRDAFSESAGNFSNMGQALIGPNIFISQVRHKAVLKVDEKGAEGAAVTSVTFGTTSLPPTFTYDKPFVLVLRHTATNAIVFAGLVNNPSQ